MANINKKEAEDPPAFFFSTNHEDVQLVFIERSGLYGKPKYHLIVMKSKL